MTNDQTKRAYDHVNKCCGYKSGIRFKIPLDRSVNCLAITLLTLKKFTELRIPKNHPHSAVKAYNFGQHK